MNTLVITKEMTKKGDLVILPRRDYEALFRRSPQAKTDWIYEKPVANYVQKRIHEAEGDFKKGKATKWQSNKK